MASSALSGDRRLASGRRGGMTVLGKVAVPKPINLPSQRLENHGLDPNVEIVPKGTLSWGSRTSTTSNAWASSTLSPRTDGGTLSPSNLSARPSSGDSATRPSTAGSDKTHDPSITARGPNSRPSSSSGAHASSQTSIVSLRPHSAETRPGSSQLSRFAEPSAENLIGGAAERLGMTSSRNDGFSLSSGDFPVLGSEKSGSGKCTVSQGHPSQESGSPPSVATWGREDNEGKNGVLNSWRREEAIFGEDGVRSGIDQWHGDSPSFQNSRMRPQHFNAWRGPVVNNHPPGSGWYRGPPGGPYGGHVVPSGFPMEPFPYYHPQAAPPVLPNPPSAPPGTGPRGHHINNGEFYRPPIRGAFIHPNMPVRPGYYPGPLPYDGYFGPQLRYRSPNEQDIAFVGMEPGVPSPCCRYPATENGNSNVSPTGLDNKISSSEAAELGHLHDSGGQYKVLLKQHDSWDDEGEEHQQGENKATSELPLNPGSQSKTVNPDNDRKLEQIHSIEKNSEMGDPKDYQKSDDRVNSSVPMKVNLPESVPGYANDVDLARRSKQKRSAPEVSQSLSFAAKDSSLIQKIESLNAKDSSLIQKIESLNAKDSSLIQKIESLNAKDSSLIQKIESLNAKSRASAIQSDTLSAADRQSQNAISQRSLLPHPATEIKNEAQVVKKNQDARNFKPERSGQIFAGSGKIHERTAVGRAIISRAYPPGGQGREQYHGERVSPPDADEWPKNPIGMDSVVPSVETSNILPNNEVGDHSVSHPLKNEAENKPVTTDSSDSPTERARFKELVKQRARRRQEEEEERARDQKARALMKLEELNKRRQLEESLNSKAESISSSGNAIKSEQQEGLHPPPRNGQDSIIVLSHESISEASPVPQIDESVSRVEGSVILSRDAVSVRSQTFHLHRGPKSAGAVDYNPENMSYKHSGVVSKEKPNRVSGELAKLNDRTTYVVKSGDSILDDINPSTEESYLSNPQNIVETTVHRRIKGSKTSRSKQSVDNLSPASASFTAVNEASRAITLEDNGMSKSLKPDLGSNFIQQLPDSKDSKQSMEHPLPPLTETTQVKPGFHGRSQNPRRTPRNQQINKLSEKLHGSDAVMWAPRSQNKIEVAVETNDGAPTEEANSSLKNDVSQKNEKYKRTEMERYIPKAVAKEMAQQGYVFQAVPLNNKNSLMEETVQGVSSVSQRIENVQSRKPVQGKEPKNLDDGQNKPGGAAGPWRQRSPKEAITKGESCFVEGKDDPIRSEDQLAKEAVVRYSKEKQKFQGHASGDRPNPVFDSDPNADVTRDHGSVARVKRGNFRGTGTGVDVKQKKGSEFTGKNHDQSSVFYQHQRLPAAVSKESHGFVDRSTSLWQPKAPKVLMDDPEGSKPRGGKWVEVEGARVDLEEPPKADAIPIARSPQKAPNDALAASHNAKFSYRTDYANEGGRPDFNVKRERRVPQNRRLTRQQESVIPAGDRVQQYESEIHVESFENQNSRYGRGNSDSRADWNPRGNYGKQQQNPPLNRERKHPNFHYRYQPVGKEDISKTDTSTDQSMPLFKRG